MTVRRNGPNRMFHGGVLCVAAILIGSAALAADIYFPQIAVGGGYRTLIRLTNTSEKTVNGQLRFFASDGQPLSLDMGSFGSSASFDLRLEKGSTLAMETTPRAGLQTGYGRFSGEAELMGTAIFQVFGPEGLVSEAAVLPSRAVSQVRLPVEKIESTDTGLALVSADGIPVQATLIGADGAPLDTQTITVKSGAQMARYFSEIFRMGTPFRGHVLLSSTGRFAAVGLRLNGMLMATLPVQVEGEAPRVTFSPQGGTQATLVAALDAAKSSLDIAIYSFTANPISEAILRAVERGVRVRIVADTSQRTLLGSEVDRLFNAGVPLRLLSGLPSGSGSLGIMHNKFVLIDQKILFTGSYNWTAAAENTHYENLVRLTDGDLLRIYGEQFEMLWSRAHSPR